MDSINSPTSAPPPLPSSHDTPPADAGHDMATMPPPLAAPGNSDGNALVGTPDKNESADTIGATPSPSAESSPAATPAPASPAPHAGDGTATLVVPPTTPEVSPPPPSTPAVDIKAPDTAAMSHDAATMPTSEPAAPSPAPAPSGGLSVPPLSAPPMSPPPPTMPSVGSIAPPVELGSTVQPAAMNGTDMPHPNTPDASVAPPKKHGNSTLLIVLILVFCLVVAGVLYASFTCKMSVPGLSSLSSCTTDSTGASASSSSASTNQPNQGATTQSGTLGDTDFNHP